VGLTNELEYLNNLHSKTFPTKLLSNHVNLGLFAAALPQISITSISTCKLEPCPSSGHHNQPKTSEQGTEIQYNKSCLHGLSSLEKQRQPF